MTRHVPHELENADWNVMILHYLGLDHIGHKAGPRRYVGSQECTLMISDDPQSKHDPQTERDGRNCEEYLPSHVR